MNKKVRITCPQRMVQVEVGNRYSSRRGILNAPPLLRSFIGRPVGEAIEWMQEQFGPARVETLPDTTSEDIAAR